jgi:hypothetical protein
MKPSQLVTEFCLMGGLISLIALPVVHAQQSSGGTPPGVTEGQQGQGQTGAKTQGVPGSGWNPNDKASGSYPEGGKTGSGAGMGSDSGKGADTRGHSDSGSPMGSGGHMGSGSQSGGQMGSGGSSGSGGSGGR